MLLGLPVFAVVALLISAALLTVVALLLVRMNSAMGEIERNTASLTAVERNTDTLFATRENTDTLRATERAIRPGRSFFENAPAQLESTSSGIASVDRSIQALLAAGGPAFDKLSGPSLDALGPIARDIRALGGLSGLEPAIASGFTGLADELEALDKLDGLGELAKLAPLLRQLRSRLDRVAKLEAIIEPVGALPAVFVNFSQSLTQIRDELVAIRGHLENLDRRTAVTEPPRIGG